MNNFLRSLLLDWRCAADWDGYMRRVGDGSAMMILSIARSACALMMSSVPNTRKRGAETLIWLAERMANGDRCFDLEDDDDFGREAYSCDHIALLEGLYRNAGVESFDEIADEWDALIRRVKESGVKNGSEN